MFKFAVKKTAFSDMDEDKEVEGENSAGRMLGEVSDVDEDEDLADKMLDALLDVLDEELC